MSADSKKLFSKDNKSGDAFNFKRKIFHLLGLIIPVGYFFNWLDPISPWTFRETTRSLIFYITGAITVFFLIVEFLRFRYKYWQDLFVKVAGPMLKDKEMNKMHGSVPYVLALCIVVGFFPREIAIICILFLSFGDPAAAYIGGKFGTIRFYNGKSLQGTLGGIAGAFISGLIFLSLISVFDPKSTFVLWDAHGIRLETWLMLFLGSVGALLIEFVSHEGFFDDNLTIPVGASVIMIVVHSLAGDKTFLSYFYPFLDLIKTTG